MTQAIDGREKNSTTEPRQGRGETSFHFGRFALMKQAFKLPAEHRDDRANIPMNPSTVMHPVHGLVSAIRLVNYGLAPFPTTLDGGDFYSRILITTKEKVLCVTPYDFNSWPRSMERKRRNEEGKMMLERVDMTSHGLEDLRLFMHDGKMKGLGSCSSNPQKFGTAGMVLLTFSDDLQSYDVLPLRWSGEEENEKNWVPWVKDEDLLFVQSWTPFRILIGAGHLERVGLEPGWSGGSEVIPWRDGHSLALVHRFVFTPQGRHYEHAFVRMQGEFLVMSRPFVFDARDGGVEFAMGLRQEANGDVCVSYGFQDKEARWAWFKPAAIEMLFE